MTTSCVAFPIVGRVSPHSPLSPPQSKLRRVVLGTTIGNTSSSASPFSIYPGAFFTLFFLPLTQVLGSPSRPPITALQRPHSKTFPPRSLAKSTLKSGKSTQNTASPFNKRILSPSANLLISIQRRILSCYFESFRLVRLPDWSDKREAFEMAQQQGQNVMRRYDFQQFCYVLGASVPEMSEVGSSNPLQRNRDPLIADTLEIIQWISMPWPPLI